MDTEPTLLRLPSGAEAITLPCATSLVLLPQRAVWWPAERTVFVADLHFGKAATFRLSGQPVPHGTTDDNLRRLDQVLAATGAAHLVFLGDFVHARPGASEALWRRLIAWRGMRANTHMTLVRGNHDASAGDPPSTLGMTLVNEPWMTTAHPRIVGCHHPQYVDGATVLAGHLHPTVRLRGLAHDRITLPCFAWTAGLLVLPAFGAFTGSAADNLPAHTQRFATTGTHVIPI